MAKMIGTLILSGIVVTTAFAGPPKDLLHEGMIHPAAPKIGKWVGKRSAESLGSGVKDLGACPLEILDVQLNPLYKTDSEGKAIYKSKEVLADKGWITQRSGKNEPRYFKRRLDQEGATLLEEGGKYGPFEFEKDELLAEYYSLEIKVDHIGVGRVENIEPKWPLKMVPNKENQILSRYDKDSKGNISSMPYFVQEHLIGLQGEITKLVNGKEVGTGLGVPEKPFYEVKIKFDPKTQTPIFLEYTAGVVTGKNENDWYFADTFNYECRDFKKVETK